LSISLLVCPLRGNIYDSIVAGLLAVLGIDKKKGRFYDAPGYGRELLIRAE